MDRLHPGIITTCQEDWFHSIQELNRTIWDQQAMEKLSLEEMASTLGGKAGGNANCARCSIFFLAGYGLVVTMFEWLGDGPAVKQNRL